MPSDISFLDNTLPKFTGEETTDNKIRQIQDYLFQMLQFLRWALRNIGVENLDKSTSELITKIDKPVYIDVVGDDGTRTQVKIEPGDIQTIVSDIMGNYTQLDQTVHDFTFQIVEDEHGMVYKLTSRGMIISSTRSIEYFSLTGQKPPVGIVGGVVVNEDGDPVLSHGWFETWDTSWSDAVYACHSYDGGETWSPVLIKQGSTGGPGEDGITMILNNNPHSFAGTETAAKAATTNVGVIAMQGDTRLAATIGTITGLPTGMSATIHSNGTPNAYITFSVNTNLTTDSGVVSVPVTVNGSSYALFWSWSISFAGSKANINFDNINDALANIFVKKSSGEPTTVTDYYIYSAEIRGGKILGSEIYAGEGTGFAQMIATGLNVFNAAGYQKVGMGFASVDDTDYPYLVLGTGTGKSSAGAALVQKLGAGLWLGEDSIVAAGGNYPGGVNSLQDISSSYPHATGLFVDINNDVIYKYINGHPSEIGAAVWG